MKNRRAAEGRQFDRASRGHVRRGADRPEPGGREQPKLDIRSLAGVLKIAPEVLRETFLADPALGRLVAATSPLLLRAAVAEQPADASPTAPLECLERVTTPAPQGGAGQRDTATPTGPEHRPEQVTTPAPQGGAGQRDTATPTGPEHRPEQVNTPAPQGGAGQRDTATPTGPKHRPELVIPRERPGFAEQTDAEYVQTPGQYTIEIANCDIRIYDPQGRRQTRIWGDPHVDEGAAGDDWHFGQDSTFILPDGTKICLDTEPNAADEWYVVGADILAGTSRYHFGVGDDAGMTQDALEFDKGRATSTTSRARPGQPTRATATSTLIRPSASR
jgi:hypothetical protein